MNWIQRHLWRYRLKNSPYQSLFNKPNCGELVALDCEATSLDPNKAELLTIAAVKIVGNRILTSQPFEVSLRAPDSLCSDSIKIHKLRHHDLIDGVSEKQALEKLIDFIGNRPMVGYHIRYDKKMLDIACRKHLGFPLPNQMVEVSLIYQDKLQKHLPNGYFDLSMDSICQHLGLTVEDKHDAFQDALSAALIYTCLTLGELPHSSPPTNN